LLGPSLRPACDSSETYDFGKQHLEDLKEYCKSFLYEYKEFLEEADSHPEPQDSFYTDSRLDFLGVQLEVITDLVQWQLRHKDTSDAWAEEAFRQPLRQLHAMKTACDAEQQESENGYDDYERSHDEAENPDGVEAENPDGFDVPGTSITNCAQSFSSFQRAVLDYIGAPRSSNFDEHVIQEHTSEEEDAW